MQKETPIAINRSQFYARSPDTLQAYYYNSGNPVADSPKLTARCFLNALDMIADKVAGNEKEITKLETEIIQLEEFMAKPFEKTAELATLRDTHAKLEREINQKLRAQNQLQQTSEGSCVAADQTVAMEATRSIASEPNVAYTIADNENPILEKKPQPRRFNGKRPSSDHAGRKKYC